MVEHWVVVPDTRVQFPLATHFQNISHLGGVLCYNLNMNNEILMFEKKESAKEKLLALEASGKYVFHGSPIKLDFLEPRQATGYNPQTKQEEFDGEPAIFATPKIDAAIFHCLVRRERVSGDSNLNWGTKEDGGWLFSATQNILDAAKDSVGYIYVFDKNEFGEFDAIQGRAKKAITPLEVIEVSYKDLPANIEILES